MNLVLFSRCWCFLVLFQVVAANVKRAPPWMYDRFYAASETPVLARAIGSDSTGKSALRTLLRYYMDMDSQIRANAAGADDELIASAAEDALTLLY